VVELELEGIAVQQQDELPPQLQKLSSHDVFSVEPLCSLTQLQELSIERASTPAAQLQRLGEALRSLRSVQLYYERASHVHRSAAGWPVLPLKSLSVDLREVQQQSVSPFTLQHIARSTGLTSLDLLGCNLLDSERWELAAALEKLTGLQQLSLLDLSFWNEEENEQAALDEQQLLAAAAAAAAEGEAPMQQPAAAAGTAAAALGPPAAAALPENAAIPDVVGWPAILRAAAGLPQLSQLSFDGPLNPATIAQLAAATQLQQLSIANSLAAEDTWEQYSPSEAVLMHLLCSLPALRKLELNDQPHLSDAAMPVIAWLMTQLTTLSLHNCGRVTNAGLEYLRGCGSCSRFACYIQA
jgi:hypothetical protein